MMKSRTLIEHNSYYDSVELMSLSNTITNREGVTDAIVAMATEMNKNLLNNIELATKESKNASQNDLIIAVKAVDKITLDNTFDFINEQLNSKKSSNQKENLKASTLKQGLEILPDANMAIISCPGKYAFYEGKKALNKGLNIMIFSDNMTISEEKELKELGIKKNLLVMGPDCGTAIINQIGLCFSNKVEKGSIGLVAASGTGLQEVSVQISRMGFGISQAIGTGGRDLHEEVGGLMMLEGIKRLDRDINTKVITLISKPPSELVQNKIIKQVKKVSKPVIICFLDGDKESIENEGMIYAPTLIQAAKKSVLAIKKDEIIKSNITNSVISNVENEIGKLNSSQKFIKGLFCGGTLTSEALCVIREKVNLVKSNVSRNKYEKTMNPFEEEHHLLLDLGSDEFTEGKPHPMIEPNLRNQYIVQEADKKSTAVLLLDFEIGYGSHQDPVGESLDTLIEAKEIAKSNNCYLSIVAYVCGTEKDKQNLKNQEKKLRDIGVIVADSNEMASNIASMIANREVI